MVGLHANLPKIAQGQSYPVAVERIPDVGTGEIKYGNPNRISKGTAIVVSGKRRYAGAKGDGTSEGEATQAGPEGIAYVDYVVNIKK